MPDLARAVTAETTQVTFPEIQQVKFPKQMIRPRYQELGDFVPDKYGDIVFTEKSSLTKKEDALLYHPRTDLGNEKSYFFGARAMM